MTEEAKVEKTLEELNAEYNELARANGKEEKSYETLAKARAGLKGLQKLLNKPTKPAKEPSAARPGIGAYAKELLVVGGSNKEVLAAVLEKFPNAKTTSACIAYYRTKLIAAGKLVSSRVAKAETAETTETAAA
jgi:hypothetical protein